MWTPVKTFFKSTAGKIAFLLGTVPAWKPAYNFIYNVIDTFGNILMVKGWLPDIWHFLSSQKGMYLVMLIGFAIAAYQLYRQHRQLQVKLDSGGKPPDRSVGSGQLVIKKAQYGAGDRWLDVTAKLQSMVSDEILTLNGKYNDLFGDDPIFGTRKELVIVLLDDGKEVPVRVQEDSKLTLPLKGVRLLK